MAWLSASTELRTLRKISNLNIFTTQKVDANQHLRWRKKVVQLISYVQESCDASRAIDIGRAAFTTTLNLISNTIFSVDDSFILFYIYLGRGFRRIKGPCAKFCAQLRFFNEYLPEDKDPLHAWLVICFVSVLALAGIHGLKTSLLEEFGICLLT
ncbi:hypothetical protein Patl1_32828 [Pistacia atlantica]|uniref:Uncharacterized protein n=1 Tax=Pistacia atlantica TaxID=434234 RepID=A0ACC1ANW6_9ROSI|nr:hypothetical protein Patl1_32828 [Pistacia atlantica]